MALVRELGGELVTAGPNPERLLAELRQRFELADDPRLGPGVIRCRRPIAATSRSRATSCAVNALVDATPISGPALVISTRSTARTRELFGTFTMPRDGPNPRRTAASRAPRVSAVSPDWESATTRVEGIRHRLAVPELACLLHAARHAGEALEPVPGDEPRVVGGAAGDDLHRPDPVEHLGGDRAERRFQHPTLV